MHPRDFIYFFSLSAPNSPPSSIQIFKMALTAPGLLFRPLNRRARYSFSLLSHAQPHYTVVNRWNDTLGEQNMIAVSLPTVLDPSLAPPGHHIIHAYAAG